MTKPYLICGLELLLLLVSVSGIVLPEHNCSDYFTYGIEDGNYIGLFTAPKAGLHRISWNVTFLWHGSITENPVASLEHYPNRMEAIHNINSGRRAQLIARFKNISEELPKLVDLQINNETLCSNPGWGFKVTSTRGIGATKLITHIDNSRREVIPVLPTIVPRRRVKF